jgi:hypothetical protein
MPSPRTPSRVFTPVRARGPVFAVGRRVSVVGSGTYSRHVALTDESSASTLANLAEGTEVEILAWRTSGLRGTRYRVRSVETGVDGWVPVASLRDPAAIAVSAPGADAGKPTATSSREEASTDTARRFGQRR